MSERSRLSIVGVMGSGTAPHAERARSVGQWLAQQGVHLLTGGGGGVMEAVSQAFFEVTTILRQQAQVIQSSCFPFPVALRTAGPQACLQVLFCQGCFVLEEV